jgi:hypothetical protein
MKSKDRFAQAYNARAAVDGTAQVIVAHGLTNGQSDQDQLASRLDDTEAHLGRRPTEASADAGYCSDANFAALAARTSRATSPSPGPSMRATPNASRSAR